MRLRLLRAWHALARPGWGAGWTLRRIQQHEDKVLLLLTLMSGAIVGLVVVAFILVTENLGSRLYPSGGSPWRRLVFPVAGALIMVRLSRCAQDARGSGVPQTKAALFFATGT